jgi:hypothetical protein
MASDVEAYLSIQKENSKVVSLFVREHTLAITVKSAGPFIDIIKTDVHLWSQPVQIALNTQSSAPVEKFT